jgi:2-C-methyl-D-erythritol 2,4-cyclodiphosphate synthase
MRIGHGYDVHRCGPGDSLVLGGVSNPHKRGQEAHTDGDVQIQSNCDALLGATGQGDIGRHFPDTDVANSGIDSRTLLCRVMNLVNQAGWVLGNLDATLIAQAPRMAPHINQMVENLASDLSATTAQVNIKATTTEKLGFTGREEGIAAHAVVLLQIAPS